MIRTVVFFTMLILIPAIALAETPVPISHHFHGASITDVWSRNQYTYATTGHGILVLDYSNPASPEEVAFHAIEGAQQLTGLDGNLYVACGPRGLAVYKLESNGALSFLLREPLGNVRDVEPGPDGIPNQVCILSDNTVMEVTLNSPIQVHESGYKGVAGLLRRITTSPVGVSGVTFPYYNEDFFPLVDTYFWGDSGLTNTGSAWHAHYADMISVHAHQQSKVLFMTDSRILISDPGSQSSAHHNLPIYYTRMHHLDLSRSGGNEIHKLVLLGRDGWSTYPPSPFDLRLLSLNQDFTLTIQDGLDLDFSDAHVGGIHSQNDGSLYLAMEAEGLHRHQVTADGQVFPQSIVSREGLWGRFAVNSRYLLKWDKNKALQWYSYNDSGILTELTMPSSPVSGVGISEKTAVIRKGDLFEIWDVVGPSPIMRDTLRVEGTKRSAFSRDRLAVRNESNEIQLYNVAAEPILKSIIVGSRAFWFFGDELVLAGASTVGHDGYGDVVGATRYDISDLGSPRILHSGSSSMFGYNERVTGVTVFGDYILATINYLQPGSIPSEYTYLAVLDFSGPERPKVVTTLYSSPDVAVVNTQTIFDQYVAVTVTGLEEDVRILGLDQRGKLVEVDSLQFAGADQVRGSGDRLFVSGKYGTLASYLYESQSHVQGLWSDVLASGVFLGWSVNETSATVSIWRVTDGEHVLLADSLSSGVASYLDADPPLGESEYWVVSEVYAGHEQWHGPLPVAITAPEFTAEVLTNGVQLSWRIQGADITAFNIYRQVDGVETQIAQDLSPDSSSFEDPEVLSGDHVYWLGASLRGGGEKRYGPIGFTVAVEKLWPEYASGDVVLHWEFRGSEVVSISVWRAAENTQILLREGLPPDTDTYRDVKPPAGDHDYTVVAELRNGRQVVLGPVAFYIKPKISLVATPVPFAETAVITFEVNQEGPCRLEIFDIQGRNTMTLVNEPIVPGEYVETWSGTDRSGSRVAAGVYFVRLSIRNLTLVQKLVHID